MFWTPSTVNGLARQCFFVLFSNQEQSALLRKEKITQFSQRREGFIPNQSISTARSNSRYGILSQWQCLNLYQINLNRIVTTKYTKYAVRQSRNQISEPLNPLNSFAQRMNKIYEWTAPRHPLFVYFINSLGISKLKHSWNKKRAQKTRNRRIVVRKRANTGILFSCDSCISWFTQYELSYLRISHSDGVGLANSRVLGRASSTASPRFRRYYSIMRIAEPPVSRLRSPLTNPQIALPRRLNRGKLPK